MMSVNPWKRRLSRLVNGAIVVLVVFGDEEWVLEAVIWRMG